MAFTTTKKLTLTRNKRIVFGNFSNTSGSTGGVIPTKFSKIESVNIFPDSSYSSYTISGGDLTIVTPSNASGQFSVVGV